MNGRRAHRSIDTNSARHARRRRNEGEPTHFEWFTLVARLEAGDLEAFRRVTGVVHGFLARYGAYRLRDSWEDIAQEAVIALLRAIRRGQLHDPRAFVSYLGAITRNKLADWVRLEERSGALSPKPEPRSDGGEVRGFIDRPRHDSRTQDLDVLLDLRAALATLPGRQQRVLDAVYLQGHTYGDAATGLDLPLGTLKRMQTQGLRNLRTTLTLAPA